MGRMQSALYHIAELFELPPEALSGVPKLTVTGCRRVMVENHRGLLHLSPEIIQIKGGKVTVTVTGDKLELRAMTRSEMLITGTVVSVSFD